MAFRRIASLAAAGTAAILLASCASTTPKVSVRSSLAPAKTKEYFAEKEYGVKASPRVTNQRSRLKRGGGRYQVGKPYQVRGKWYYPKEEPGYSRTGKASWYGDAFHGRLTANGEIYDMTHLSAAHPTMPLPSYARVTNLKNGASVIVRVNDRGPYAHGRVIDMSKRAAQMLGYISDGTATVKVDYVGPARLDGQDDQYLVASYVAPGGQKGPDTGLPAGVMMAMNGSTPDGGSSSRPVVAAVMPVASLPGVNAAAGAIAPSTAQPVPVSAAPSVAKEALPDSAPVPFERPEAAPVKPLAYADERIRSAVDAFAALDRTASLTPEAITTSWKKGGSANPAREYVAAGTFDDEGRARALLKKLGKAGRGEVEVSRNGQSDWYTVNVYPAAGASVDEVLEAAWKAGANDAFVVRP